MAHNHLQTLRQSPTHNLTWALVALFSEARPASAFCQSHVLSSPFSGAKPNTPKREPGQIKSNYSSEGN